MLKTIEIPFVWMTVSVIVFATGVNCTVCTDKAKHYSVPVVRFCTADEEEGNPVIMDGFYANRLNIISCVCMVNITKSAESEKMTLTYENAYNVSSIQNIRDCGSSVNIIWPSVQQQSKSCTIDGSTHINITNSDIQLGLRKDRPDGNTSYCFKLGINSNFVLHLSCVKTDVTESSTKMTSPTNTYSSTENLEMASIQVTPEYTDDTNISSIPTQQSNTNTPEIGVTDTIQNNNKDNSMLMYIAIGCGTIGGLLLIMVICLVKISRSRRRSRSSYVHNYHNDNDGEYGLQYNALYLSTTDNGIQPNKDEASSSKNGVDMTKIAYQVDGNYSDMDLNDMPLRENCIHNLTNTAIRDGIETPNDGNYSEVGLVEKQTPVNNYDNDNKGFITSAKFKNSSFSVKHVISPGGDGCEYTVVEKQNGSNDRNVIYSVVDKTNKHNL